MKYKIIDKQGAGMRAEVIYSSKKEILEYLLNFHNQDYSGVKDNNEPYKDIYEFINTIPEEERLDWILDYGSWEIEEYHITELEKAYDSDSGEEQERACIKEIKRILDDKNTNQCEFLINLRDFLLDYTIKYEKKCKTRDSHNFKKDFDITCNTYNETQLELECLDCGESFNLYCGS